MAVKNSLVKKEQKEQKVPFSVQINSKGYQTLINNTLKDRNTANRFIASIVSAVSATPALAECEAKSIVSAALLGEGLKLSPSPQLGQYYLIPFECQLKDENGNTIWLKNEKGEYIKNERGYKIPSTVKRAQFVLGYKGYIQLAIRSGQYKKLNVLPIKQGELIRFDPLNEEIEVQLIEDETEREKTDTTGYYAMFEYINGFKKAMYWSKEKMLSHADKYSAAFSLNGTSGKYTKVSYADYVSGNYDSKTEWLYSSFWYKDFDGMACKTMLRQLISKWGIMSIEMQKAVESDMGVIGNGGTVEYVDIPTEPENVPINAAVSEPPEVSGPVEEDFEKILEE